MALGLTACSNDYTVAYVYMVTAKTLPHGLINGYQVDYQSGSLLPLADSPIDAGGRNPVTLVAAPNNLFLYSINHDDSNVVEFAIGTDGKLYSQHAYNITGSFATGAAIDPAGKFLYVTFTYQNSGTQQLYTPANPGPGGVTVFPINSDNTLGTPLTVNTGRNPVGIVASKLNHFVYVIEQDSVTSLNLLGFSANQTTGNLTPLAGTTINAGNVVSPGYVAGISPSAILEDATSTHLYVTDSVANQITSYTIAASGVPNPFAVVSTEAAPVGMSFDPSGTYLYTVNFGANTIDGFTFGSSGQALRSTTAGSVQTGTGPTCVTTIGSPSSATPTHAIYMYVSNSLTNSITGEQLLASNGSLEQIQGTPFGGSALPACLVSVPALPH